MKLHRIKKLMLGLLVAGALLVGIGSTTANAQNRGFHRRPHRVIVYRRYDPFWDHRLYRVVDPIAALKEQGYSNGREQGKDDAKYGREFDPDGHKRFDKSKSLAYREAFLKGYEDGYRKEMKKGD